MEEIISQKKTKFESSELFLFPLYAFMFLVFSVILLFIFPLGVIVPVILFLILLDKLMWGSKGIETILCDETNLMIRRKPKIFNRKLVLPLREIEAVEYREQTTLESSWYGPSVSDER